MSPSIGRIVVYTLSDEDAFQINRRRTTPDDIRHRINNDKWPLGAQAHIGNTANPRDQFPAMVVRVFESNTQMASLQVFLDGNDVFWAGSRIRADEPTQSMWNWPERAS